MMDNKKVVLYGPDGLPIKRQSLTKEIAAPSLTGVRNAWSPTVASGLTPDRLATIMRAAAEGDAHDYLVLAEEMEEREIHYQSVLGTRKRAIGSVEMAIEPASDAPKDKEIADAVRTHILHDPNFVEILDDLLDALAKGYSVAEIVWKRGRFWTVERYEYRDPRFFTWDRETGKQIRLIDESNPLGILLPSYRFITHIPRLKSGLPIRGGLARLAAMAFMCKSYTVKDWHAFLEVFGMPLRLGRYGPNATQDDIDVLVQAVANIGTDAAAILPEGMRIDFEQAAQGGGAGNGAAVFQSTAEWWDRQISKGVLGQTASSEGTPGKLGNEDSQEDVRRDILRSDCRQLALTINRDLIRAFVDINFGAQESYPTFSMPVLEPEDIALIIEALDKLADKGLTVKASEVRAKLGFSDPQAGDEVIGKKAEEASAPKPDMEKAANRSQKTVSIDDEIEELGLENWQAQMQPVIDPIEELFNNSENFEDVLQGLRGLEMDMETMIRSLAAATFKAYVAGDADAD